MEYVLVLQLILGAELDTIWKKFDTAYPCYSAEYEIKTIGLPPTKQLERYKDHEMVARCYELEAKPPSFSR